MVSEPKAPPAPAAPGVEKRFVLDNLIVAAALILQKMRAFVTLPLIVATVGTEGFGLWSQIFASITFLSFATCLNLHLPLVRFVAADRASAAKVYSTLISVEIALTSVIALALVGFAGPASELLFGDRSLTQHLLVGLVFVLLTNVRMMNVNLYRAFGRFFLRTFVELAASIVELAAIALALIFGGDLLTTLVAMTAASGLIAIATTLHASRLAGIARPEKEIARKALGYALPAVPQLLSLWALDRADRFFVGAYWGAKEVGIYSASYALGGLVLHLQAPFQMTLLPKVSELWDTDRTSARRYIELCMRFFLTLGIPFTIGAVAFAPPLLVRLGNEEIAARSAWLTAIVALGVLFYGVSILQMQVLHGAKRTGILGVIGVGSAGLNIALNFALVPRWGSLGAAIATAVGYGAGMIACDVAARKILPLRYGRLFLTKCLLAALLMCFPLFWLRPYGTGAFVGSLALGLVVYFGVLTLLGAWSAEERAFIGKLRRKILRSRA